MTSKEERSVSMSYKISRSSLGTPAARKLRSRTPAAVTKKIVARSSSPAIKRLK